jgi:hypothetical protein
MDPMYQVRRYLDCGLFENGCARIRCPNCAEEYLLAFSCTMRELFLSCAAERSAATAALPAEEVLKEIMWASLFGPSSALVIAIVVDARLLRGQKSR